jgi:hypothetical protein
LSSHPLAPAGWVETARRRVGPFTTHVAYRTPDGEQVEWGSRSHRKRRSLLSRADVAGRVWWAPRRASWWIAVLFAIGSACFFVGPFPGFVALVGSKVDGIVFFVGSIFFTSAAALQWLETINADPGPVQPRRRFRALSWEPRRIDWWASGIQLAGTLFFNVNTWHAMQTGLDAQSYDALVWTPDIRGCACFLVASWLAYAEVGGRARTLGWWIAALNLLGSVFFAVSAVAAYWVPDEGSVLDLAAANLFTALGGLCFLAGAVLLLPEGAAAKGAAAAAPAVPTERRA